MQRLKVWLVKGAITILVVQKSSTPQLNDLLYLHNG